MIVSVGEQAYLFLISIAVGGVCGLVYDNFRVVRKLIKHKKINVYLEDGLFWIIVTGGTYYIFLHKNDGEVRLYMLLGIGLGFVVYILTISKIFVKIYSEALKIVMVSLYKTIRLILYPIRVVIRACKTPIKKANNVNKKVLRKSKRYVKINSMKIKKQIKVIAKKI